MKTIIRILFILFFIPLYGITKENNTVLVSINQNLQERLTYKYGVHTIDKEVYIRNLGNNVQSYVASKNWNQYECEEFAQAYGKFMEALKNDRLSADDFGTITDSAGGLKESDEEDYWYDYAGNRITGTQYRALSVRKKKKYRTFYANREVVTYFNEIAKAIVNKMYSN